MGGHGFPSYTEGMDFYLFFFGTVVLIAGNIQALYASISTKTSWPSPARRRVGVGASLMLIVLTAWFLMFRFADPDLMRSCDREVRTQAELVYDIEWGLYLLYLALSLFLFDYYIPKRTSGMRFLFIYAIVAGVLLVVASFGLWLEHTDGIVGDGCIIMGTPPTFTSPM